MVAINAVAALEFLVVDLSASIALRADTADKVVAGQAAAGTDGGIPDFVGLAGSTADAVDGIIGLKRGADTTAVTNKVVSGLALAVAVEELLVGVAGRGAEAEVEEVALIADTLLGDCAVSRVEGA